jgi:hypothetical protein
MNEWISVEDRLPEKGYQLVWEAGYPNVGYVASDGKWRVDRDEVTPYVTHWMPLPDPPEATT